MTRNLLASTMLAALSFGAAHALTLNTGGSTLAEPTYQAEYTNYTNGHPTVLTDYEGVGSGSGQNAFLANDIGLFENLPAGTLTYGTIVGTTVDIGASDAALLASQLTNPATGSYSLTLTTNGVTYTGSSSTSGPLIQIPTFGVPVTMAYNESKVPSAGLTLKDGQICGVLSGKITDWHTLVSTIPAGTTIHVVYRSDGSGTTFLTTQHLNAVCTTANSNFSIPVAVTTHFSTLFTAVPSNFIGESGSYAVAQQALSQSGSFTYLSPDYTAIAPKSASTTTLKTAKVVNASNGTAYAPNVANTETGLAHAGPASTGATPPATKAAAMNPLNWVPLIPTTTSGYPIVGYTTMDLSSCYANKTAGTAINNFLLAQLTNSAMKTIITNNGFAPLVNTSAAPYATSIQHIFLGNSSGYNLNIDNATTCANYAGR